MHRNFLFHRVNPHRDPLWDPMDVQLFDRCIAHISKKFEVALIEELAFSDDLNSKNRYATIMFDDGYKDNIEYAAEILDKHKVNASFYVVTNCIDKNIPTWTHILEHQFQQTAQKQIDLNFDFLPEELRIKSLTSSAERIDYVKRLKPVLKSLTHEERNTVLEVVSNAYEDVEFPQIMMNWADLKELQQAGHYIGSHTVTHCMLGTMNDENEIRSELTTSADRIEQKLGHRPVSISYPIGSYNDQTKSISKSCGYNLGLAVNQTIYDPAKQDKFEISRIELYNEPWWKTKLRISNKLEELKSLIGYR